MNKSLSRNSLLRPFEIDVDTLEEHLSVLLSNILSQDSGCCEPGVKILVPPSGAVSDYIRFNSTLRAEMSIFLKGLDESFSIFFPWPTNGVFVFSSKDNTNGNASKWIWHPRLIGIPGIWWIRQKRYKENVIFLVQAGGRYLNIKPQGSSETTKVSIRRFVELACISQCVDSNVPPLKEKLLDFLKITTANLKERGDWHKETLNAFLTELQSMSTDQPPLDEQDIRWQRLQTYSAWLVDSIVALFVDAMMTYLKKSGADTKEKKDGLWSHLCRTLNNRHLVPRCNRNVLFEEGRLHFFDPVNGLDALSRLNSFQRYDSSSSSLEHLPAQYRQNHPSFCGLVCPVESPESKKVGLTLQLARGARVDVIGRLFKTESESPDQQLGYGASLVPFYQHNDGPRCMMGAKNMKQALPIKGAERPALRTGVEDEISELVTNLAATGVVPKAYTPVPGVDLCVAYMPWYGWNMEDAIVVGEHLVEDGILDYHYQKDFLLYIHPDFRPAPPEFEQTLAQTFQVLNYEEDTHLRKPGHVTPETPLCFFSHLETKEKYPVYCGGDGCGELVLLEFVPPPVPGAGGILKWKVDYSIPLGVGDKLMGRYGNKGVISKFLPPEQMPRFPEDSRLPKGLSGRPVDLILNPHGVISRMNLGQLMETQLGLLYRLGRYELAPDAGRAFVSSCDIRKMQEAFLAINVQGEEPLFDEYGRIRLCLPDGTMTASPVTVGFQHIFRLRHIAEKKAQARRGGRHYHYDIRTGQPVAGKKQQGGQRIGEMEIWALAANMAENVIKNILSLKSDPSFSEDSRSCRPQTFQAIIDHLLAYGIAVRFSEKEGNQTARLKLLSFDDMKSFVEVKSTATWKKAVTGRLRCPHPNCNFSLKEKFTLSRSTQRSSEFFLSVEDLLRCLGYRPVYPEVDRKEDSIKLRLEGISGKKKGRYLTIDYQQKKRSLRLDIRFDKKTVYHAYTQLDKTTVDIKCLMGARITCQKHKTKHLRPAIEGFRLICQAGGLCDENIFGNISLKNRISGSGGYIKLPGDIFNKKREIPLFQGMAAQAEKKGYALLPVLPLRYRYRNPEFSTFKQGIEEEKLTGLYKMIIAAAQNDKVNVDFILGRIENISDMLEKRLFGKMGLIRRNGLGRRVDLSGRLVIVPDPTLDWDSCGVPVKVLLELMGHKIANSSFVLDRYIRDYSDAEKLWSAICRDAGFTPDERNKVLDNEFWDSSCWSSHADRNITDNHLRLAWEIVRTYLAEHPEIRVLLNRQPSLHRYSMMGFRPHVLPPEQGMVLKIHPLVCKGFGADFDGDEMAIHMPATDEEYAELDAMMPSRQWNLLSVANGSPMLNFDQDIVSGHFYISLNQDYRQNLAEILPVASCGKCRDFLNEQTPWLKQHGDRLLKHLVDEHADNIQALLKEWTSLAFSASTNSGLSFGFMELAMLQQRLSPVIQDMISELTVQDEKKLIEITDEAGKKVLAELETLIDSNRIHDPGFGFASLAVSGARGRKQTRQLVGIRGLLSPGEVSFENEPNDFFFPVALVEGMSPATSFNAAMNARSSMVDKKLGTGKAGYLTRRLVLILWDWIVEKGDCGSTAEDRPLYLCKWQDRKMICSQCYGKVSGFESLPEGYPAGLIAAQSFGERGTQLSMQSFHTGDRQLSVNNMKDLLDGKDPELREDSNWFDSQSKAEGFVKRIKKIGAYEQIEKRHIQLIWLAIHNSTKHTMPSAWQETRTPLSGIVGPRQKKAMLHAVEKEQEEDFNSAIVKVLTGRTPVHVTQEKKREAK